MPSACIRVLNASKNSLARGISSQIKALLRLRAFLLFPRLILTYFRNWGKLRLLAGVGTSLGRLETPWGVFRRVLTTVRVLAVYMKTTAPATFCQGDVRSLTPHDLQPIAVAKCHSCEMKLQFPETLILLTGNSHCIALGLYEI